MKPQKIKEVMKNKKISMYKLSKTSKLGYATIHDIVNGKVINPRVDTMLKIATALGETIETLI